jgi:PBP1b-binding outer membrane lipoprotein LpoB
MKPVVFLLVLLLSACASQNNTPTPQQNYPKAKPTKQSTQTVKNQAKQTTAIAEKKTAPEQPIQENTTTNVTNNALTAKKPIESKKPDPNSFTCIYDSIYKVYAASSVESDGGKFLVTIDNDKLTAKSLSSEIPGTYHLQLQRRDQFKIFAKTKSKQFIYSVSSGNFVFNTGIGPSGFNISKGGHTGRQMRASGKCVNN